MARASTSAGKASMMSTTAMRTVSLLAPAEAGDQADRAADEQADGDRDDPGDHGDPGAVDRRGRRCRARCCRCRASACVLGLALARESAVHRSTRTPSITWPGS